MQQGSGALEGELESHTVVVEVRGLGAAQGAVDSLLCASPRWRLGAAVGGRLCIISSMRSSTAAAAGAEGG